MSPIAGPLFAAALLVALAGVAKAARPDPARVALRTVGLPASVGAVRVLGTAEVVVAGAVLGLGGRAGGALVLVAYLGFAGFASVLGGKDRRAVPCGCFGSGRAPVGRLHVGVNLALAAVGAIAMIRPTAGVVTVLRSTPLGGIPFAGFTLLLTWLLLVTLTALPELLDAAADTPTVAR